MKSESKNISSLLELEPVRAEFAVLRKLVPKSSAIFAEVETLAHAFLYHLNSPEICAGIGAVHKPGEPSTKVQEVVKVGAERLGFVSEKKLLFANSSVAALRPDYFARIGQTGVLLEVERGKTIMNNHYCPVND